jgi:exonuclease VII small subunit
MNQADRSERREPSMTALEERVHLLESTVATLADALRLLAHGLEGGPLSGPGDQPVAEAARKAYDLLLAIEARPAQETGPGSPDLSTRGSRPR